MVAINRRGGKIPHPLHTPPAQSQAPHAGTDPPPHPARPKPEYALARAKAGARSPGQSRGSTPAARNAPAFSGDLVVPITPTLRQQPPGKCCGRIPMAKRQQRLHGADYRGPIPAIASHPRHHAPPLCRAGPLRPLHRRPRRARTGASAAAPAVGAVRPFHHRPASRAAAGTTPPFRRFWPKAASAICKPSKCRSTAGRRRHRPRPCRPTSPKWCTFSAP